MDGEIIKLKWKRPESSDYPRVWHTFKARDLNSDELVEYRIQDLPESKFQSALDFFNSIFIRDEPTCEAYDLITDALAVEDITLMARSIIKQKSALACFKEGSDEIVGMNMNFVTVKDEHFTEDVQKCCKSETTNTVFDVVALLYNNFDTCEYYGVDKYLTSLGLVVDRKYRGRGIGEQLLKSRKQFCEVFGIKLSSTAFTSNFSNRIADKVGFELVKEISFDNVRKNHPEFALPPIKSDFMALKTIVF